MMRETGAVLALAESLCLTLSAVHVRGELNVLPDMLSRNHAILRNEWRLETHTFQWLCDVSAWG